jgi:hypothetical protein
MIKRSSRVLALASAAAGVLLLAPPASAAPPVTFPPETHDDTFVFTCDAGTPDDVTDDFTAVEHHVGGGELTVKYRPSAPADFAFATFRGFDDGTYTATWPGGRTVVWTSHTDSVEKDRRILSVEGDVATLLVGTTFNSVIYAPDGTRDSANVGQAKITVTIDLTTGEGNFDQVIKQAGHRGVGTLCGDAMRFAGLT